MEDAPYVGGAWACTSGSLGAAAAIQCGGQTCFCKVPSGCSAVLCNIIDWTALPFGMTLKMTLQALALQQYLPCTSWLVHNAEVSQLHIYTLAARKTIQGAALRHILSGMLYS